MRFEFALSVLLASTCDIGTRGFSSVSLHERNLLRSQSSIRSTSNIFVPSDGFRASNITDAIADAVNTDDDAEEQELSARRERMRRRVAGAFQVTLPFDGDEANGIGMRVRQVAFGRQIYDSELNLDNLEIEPCEPDSCPVGSACIADDEVQSTLDPNYRGLVVSSVIPNSAAWTAGIRPGDLLIATSATVGRSVWPTGTLDGLKSALLSRRVVYRTNTLELKRPSAVQSDNIYELTLPRPIGLQLKETIDGFVQVTGFTESAPTLVRMAVKVGDRVLAVDSSLGDTLWPVSTVDGVISACTSRLPGQQVRIQFERPAENLTIEDKATTMAQRIAVSEESMNKITPDSNDILVRCREAIKRYGSTESRSTVGDKFSEKFSVPALVADKVVETLLKASAALDAVTLSTIMRAYLSCGEAKKAIQLFEASTGLNGDGSTQLPAKVLEDSEGRTISPNEGSLNRFTICALLKAHSIRGDVSAVKRVVKAMEGDVGSFVDGQDVASWPEAVGAPTLQLDTQCYNVVISAIAKHGGDEGVDNALDLFDSLGNQQAHKERQKVRRNLVTFNSMTNALVRAGRYEEALDVFYMMKSTGIKPDKFTYTSLVKACVNDGDVLELRYDMKEQGVVPDVVTYNMMIRQLCSQRKLMEAKNLVGEMEKNGVFPDSMTYGELMTALLKEGKARACLSLFESAFANDRTRELTENIHIYTKAITAAAMLGDEERTLELISRMNVIGVKANLKATTAIIGACLSSGNAKLAADLYKRIDKPDGYATLQGIRAMCTSGDLETAASIVRKEKRGDRIMSGKQLMKGYEQVLTAALEYDDYEMAKDMFTDLLRKSYIPSKALVHGLLEQMRLVDRSGRVTASRNDCVEEKFGFLLFMIDSLRNRNLVCHSLLYSAAVVCGTRVGGSARQVVAMMVEARTSATEGSGKNTIISDGVDDEAVLLTWEELYAKSSTSGLSDQELYDKIPVSSTVKDKGQVLFAERLIIGKI